MGVQTKLSAKGQCVIPAEVRERLGWREGDVLEVTHVAGGIALRRSDDEVRAKLGGPISWDEFRQRAPKYSGPRKTLDEIERGIQQGYAERAARASKRA
ncbi:MAG: AbrB/MazE/SpoVT family DNA-binding domain-containing protein [Sphingomonadaceae bacterium]|nr:AbrB/MazE/SpoVT family DNA-binding domain-containing protein [Sphingomonadaceae bacterium]